MGRVDGGGGLCSPRAPGAWGSGGGGWGPKDERDAGQTRRNRPPPLGLRCTQSAPPNPHASSGSGAEDPGPGNPGQSGRRDCAPPVPYPRGSAPGPRALGPGGGSPLRRQALPPAGPAARLLGPARVRPFVLAPPRPRPAPPAWPRLPRLWATPPSAGYLARDSGGIGVSLGAGRGSGPRPARSPILSPPPLPGRRRQAVASGVDTPSVHSTQ